MIQARNYTATAGRQIDLAVVHSMESPETPSTAENVASWFAGDTAPKASAHWCHDADSSVRCVLDKDVAWHAPGASHNGIGHELAGRAAQNRGDWLDDYSDAVLRRAAAQIRVDCDRYGIPIRFVDAAGLRRGERGITTHAAVSEAFRRSTHWDPGPDFPVDVLLALVLNTRPGAAGGPVTGPEPALRVGSRGPEVTAWQKILVGASLLPASGVDGRFGPKTEAATRTFQTRIGVTADGIVGPATREATARLLAWLAAAKPIPAVPPYPGVARRGDRGGQVRVWQDTLNDRAGAKLAVDGVFGPATEAAVRAFQRRERLAVDGIAGPATWHALVH